MKKVEERLQRQDREQAAVAALPRSCDQYRLGCSGLRELLNQESSNNELYSTTDMSPQPVSCRYAMLVLVTEKWVERGNLAVDESWPRIESSSAGLGSLTTPSVILSLDQLHGGQLIIPITTVLLGCCYSVSESRIFWRSNLCYSTYSLQASIVSVCLESTLYVRSF